MEIKWGTRSWKRIWHVARGFNFHLWLDMNVDITWCHMKISGQDRKHLSFLSDWIRAEDSFKNRCRMALVFFYFFAFLFHICRLKNPENNRNELWIAVQSSSTSKDRCFAGFQNDMNYLDGGNDEIRSEWPEDSEGSSWSEAKMARNPEKSSKNPMIMWRTARKEDGAAQIQQ